MSRHDLTRAILTFVIAALALTSTGRAQPASRHVVVVTIDGLRWQEFFGGADRDYFKRDKSGSAGEPERRFWRADAADRRADADAVHVEARSRRAGRSSATPPAAASRA